jgi:hypothetical protein
VTVGKSEADFGLALVAGALLEFPKGMKESRLVAKKESLHCLHKADQSFVDKGSVQL